MGPYLNPCWIGLNWEQLSSSAGLDLCCVSWEDLSSVSPCLKASASGQSLHEVNVIPDLSLRNTERRLFRSFKLITQLKTCSKLSTSSLETTGSCKSFFCIFAELNTPTMQLHHLWWHATTKASQPATCRRKQQHRPDSLEEMPTFDMKAAAARMWFH